MENKLSNEEILNKAMEKAVKNGYNSPIDKDYNICYVDEMIEFRKQVALNYIDVVHENAIIFSHDFAKAFWGEEEKKELGVTDGMIQFDYTVEWQYHLQQLVLCEKPIKYLEKFI